MRFRTDEEANYRSSTTFRNGNMFLILTYRSQSLAKVGVLNVMPEISITWLVVAVLASLEEDEVTILVVMQIPKQNWSNIGMELALPCKQDHIDQLHDLIDFLDDIYLSVLVEGRKPRCHICKLRGFLS